MNEYELIDSGHGRKLERFGEEPVRMGRIVKGKGDVRFR